MQRWQAIPILECSEPLEVVFGERLVTASAYLHRYRHALTDVWLRRSVGEALKRAATLLPEGLSLVLWDGWRPVELQRALYDTYRRDISARTGLHGDALENETQRFVSLPSTDPACPSPHLTGGSIDLTLADAQGRPLDMGGEFDELGERSLTVYYERPTLSPEHVVFRDRRRLLCSVMTHAGFSNYPEEWWHFDMGNQFHHFRVGGPARFGPVVASPARGKVRHLSKLFEQPRS